MATVRATAPDRVTAPAAAAVPPTRAASGLVISRAASRAMSPLEVTVPKPCAVRMAS